MKTPIEDRLQASIKYDAINGDSIERGMVGMQIQEAIYKIRELKSLLAKALEAKNEPSNQMAG